MMLHFFKESKDGLYKYRVSSSGLVRKIGTTTDSFKIHGIRSPLIEVIGLGNN